MHITYNDDAMINVMKLLRYVVQQAVPYDTTLVDEPLRQRCEQAFNNGIDCILRTQIVVDGEPTVWCQQHDHETLQPAKARSYELPSFVSHESATIVAFLMQLPAPDKRIVRAMPNTTALLGQGMTGVSFDTEKFSVEERGVIDDFFSSFGKYEKVDEKLMSAVVCASGSSPAYVYMFIEALADSAVKYGMPRDKAYAFVAQAVKGSEEMVLQNGAHPAKLKDDVCSPAGTTIAGVAALEEYGFRNSIIKATDACYKKAEHID